MSTRHRRRQSGVFVERHVGGIALEASLDKILVNKYVEDADIEGSVGECQNILHRHCASVRLSWLLGAPLVGGSH